MNIFVFATFLLVFVNSFLTPGYSSFFDPAWIEQQNALEQQAGSPEKKQKIRPTNYCEAPATCDDCRFLSAVSRV